MPNYPVVCTRFLVLKHHDMRRRHVMSLGFSSHCLDLRISSINRHDSACNFILSVVTSAREKMPDKAECPLYKGPGGLVGGTLSPGGARCVWHLQVAWGYECHVEPGERGTWRREGVPHGGRSECHMEAGESVTWHLQVSVAARHQPPRLSHSK